jgi:hypothetical protein
MGKFRPVSLQQSIHGFFIMEIEGVVGEMPLLEIVVKWSCQTGGKASDMHYPWYFAIIIYVRRNNASYWI